jgi:LPPG:FO 2-phospho-L-lactate transferase
MASTTSEHTLGVTLTVLCGGLGGSRLVDALAGAAGPESVTAVGNVGDDVEVLGLAVSPDLDTVLYTLAGLLDESRGWGVRDESYQALDQVAALGGDTWFTLGDRDIGLHLVRTESLRQGNPLSAVTDELARALGVRVRLLPATDDRVRTVIVTDAGDLEFQEWFVARRHEDAVRGVRYEGAAEAVPAPGVVAALAGAEAVVIAPSNPFVSIRPILAVPGIESAIRSRQGPVAAVSPVIAGRALRGPLVGMLETLGHEPTALGVAELYAGLVDVFVLDRMDANLADDVEALGMRPVICETVMLDPDARREVGQQVLEGILG